MGSNYQVYRHLSIFTIKTPFDFHNKQRCFMFKMSIFSEVLHGHAGIIQVQKYRLFDQRVCKITLKKSKKKHFEFNICPSKYIALLNIWYLVGPKFHFYETQFEAVDQNDWMGSDFESIH